MQKWIREELTWNETLAIKERDKIEDFVENLWSNFKSFQLNQEEIYWMRIENFLIY